MPLFIVESVRWNDVEEQLRQLPVLQLPDQEDVSDIRPWLGGGKVIGQSGFITRHNDERKGGKEYSKWHRIQSKVEELLEKTAISPLEGIKAETCFLEDEDLTNPRNRLEVDEAIRIWSHKINNWSLSKFEKMYEKSDVEHLKFSVSKTYYDIEESFKILDNLLKFQFSDDEKKIIKFLQILVNVIDKQPDGYPDINPKNNCIVVLSPPSAGKNFFFDTIFALLLNFGQLGSANKHNVFSFQDMANRRIVLWNEPNYSSDQTEHIKTIFEGGDTKARVKNQADTHVKRTPVIVLTNNVVNFMVETAFKDRIQKFTWQTAPFLQQYKLKPYPLSFFKLLKKYNIYYK